MTPSHYAEFTELKEKYAEYDFEILAFPCNQFADQAPGTETELRKMFDDEFTTTIPIFNKVDAKGPNINPLWNYLTKTIPHVDASKCPKKIEVSFFKPYEDFSSIYIRDMNIIDRRRWTCENDSSIFFEIENFQTTFTNSKEMNFWVHDTPDCITDIRTLKIPAAQGNFLAIPLTITPGPCHEKKCGDHCLFQNNFEGVCDGNLMCKTDSYSSINCASPRCENITESSECDLQSYCNFSQNGCEPVHCTNDDQCNYVDQCFVVGEDRECNDTDASCRCVTMFACADGLRDIPRTFVCDTETNCRDNSDEMNYCGSSTDDVVHLMQKSDYFVRPDPVKDRRGSFPRNDPMRMPNSQDSKPILAALMKGVLPYDVHSLKALAEGNQLETGIYAPIPKNLIDVRWNFEKFLIDRNGIPVKRYKSDVKPLQLEDMIRKLLNLPPLRTPTHSMEQYIPRNGNVIVNSAINVVTPPIILPPIPNSLQPLYEQELNIHDELDPKFPKLPVVPKNVPPLPHKEGLKLKKILKKEMTEKEESERKIDDLMIENKELERKMKIQEQKLEAQEQEGNELEKMVTENEKKLRSQKQEEKELEKIMTDFEEKLETQEQKGNELEKMKDNEEKLEAQKKEEDSEKMKEVDRDDKNFIPNQERSEIEQFNQENTTSNHIKKPSFINTREDIILKENSILSGNGSFFAKQR